MSLHKLDENLFSSVLQNVKQKCEQLVVLDHVMVNPSSKYVVLCTDSVLRRILLESAEQDRLIAIYYLRFVTDIIRPHLHRLSQEGSNQEIKEFFIQYTQIQGARVIPESALIGLIPHHDPEFAIVFPTFQPSYDSRADLAYVTAILRHFDASTVENLTYAIRLLMQLSRTQRRLMESDFVILLYLLRCYYRQDPTGAYLNLRSGQSRHVVCFINYAKCLS